ncbi:hypothetical protein ACLESD_15820 [Pyxidicoccus sp. 3LFB2]
MTDAETWLYAQRQLVELFVRLSENHPLLQQAENEVPLGAGLEQQVARAVDLLLDEQQPLPEAMNPLVKLRGLDRFLLLAARGSPSPSTWLEADGRLYLLYRRSGSARKPRIQGQMGHLRTWMEHHWVFPKKVEGYDIELVQPNRLLTQGFGLLRERRELLKVAACHFEDGVKPLWRPDLKPERLQASDLTDPKRRWDSVLMELERAVVEKVHVLVLPELTIPPVLRERIQEWLLLNHGRHSLLLVLAGSFHEPDPTQPCGACNRTQLLDGKGRVVLDHRKLVKYGRTGAFEYINPGRTIQLLTLPVGLVATPICLDFCQANHPIRTLWKVLGPDWLLVPAMGGAGSVSAHRNAARDLLLSHGSRTVLANQSDEEAPVPGFVDDAPRDARLPEPLHPAPTFQLGFVRVWSEGEEAGNIPGPMLVN